jgi:hypothetical protein
MNPAKCSLKGWNWLQLYVKIQLVPRSEHFPSVTKTNQSLLYTEIIAFFFRSTQNTNTLCGQNVELVDVKPGGTYINYWNLKGPHLLLQQT